MEDFYEFILIITCLIHIAWLLNKLNNKNKK